MAVYSSHALTNGLTLYRGPCDKCGCAVEFHEFGHRIADKDGNTETELFFRKTNIRWLAGVKFGYAVNGAVAWHYLCKECLTKSQNGV
jgi:hypothetical protein